jgi:DNA-binding GntR family transcriptional regulator
MLKRHSLREQVREALLAKIASGELQPGDRVVEAQIASEMDVSPIPIREAIRELVAMGVLHAEIHRGAWVREVSLPETIEALEVRSALDVLAIRKAAKRLRGQCDRLRQLVAAIVEAAERRDFIAFQQHNQSFHHYILEQAGNPVLLRVYDSLAFEVRARAIMDYLVSVDPVAIAREHEAIVDALECGNIRRAAWCAARHSEHLIRYLQKEAAKRNDQPVPTTKKKGRQRQQL